MLDCKACTVRKRHRFTAAKAGERALAGLEALFGEQKIGSVIDINVTPGSSRSIIARSPPNSSKPTARPISGRTEQVRKILQPTTDRPSQLKTTLKVYKSSRDVFLHA